MAKRRTKNYALMKHMRIIRQFVLAFIAGVGFILLWSGISRWGNINMTHGQSIAVGIGLLLVSGFFAKIFIKNFS